MQSGLRWVLLLTLAAAAVVAGSASGAERATRAYLGAVLPIPVVCEAPAEASPGGACFPVQGGWHEVVVRDAATAPVGGEVTWWRAETRLGAAGYCGATVVEVPDLAERIEVAVFARVDAACPGVPTTGTIDVIASWTQP